MSWGVQAPVMGGRVFLEFHVGFHDLGDHFILVGEAANAGTPGGSEC